MREVILGTAGHVDHGKTSLVRALTGIDCDRLKEEKERGITIELGFAFLDLPCGHRLGIVDVPGHEKFIRNMVAGAAGMDLVAFIIAADEGIMPQTREHFEICQLLGLQNGLIIVTKKDVVEPDWLELVEEEIREFFTGTFLENAPLLPVSSTTGDGIDKVRETLDQLVAAADFTETHGPFRLPIDRVFTMKGFGSVITGTSISGRVKTGEELMIYPTKLPAKIRGIQVHGQDADLVEAGRRTAINIQGVDREQILRGYVAATPGALQPSYLLDASFLFLAGNTKPLKNRTRVRLHLGTAEIISRVVLLDDEELPPGSEADIQLLLEEPIGVWPRDRYVLRSYSPITTIGGGVILNASPRKRKRFKPENREIYQIYRHGSQEDLIRMHVRESGFQGLTIDRLAVKTGIFGNRLQKIIQQPLSTRQLLYIDGDKTRLLEESVYNNLADRTLKTLAAFHQEYPLLPGLANEELRGRLHRNLDQRLFGKLISDLAKKGEVVHEQGVMRLASHRVALQEHEQDLRRKLENFYEQTGLAVPTLKEVAAEFSAYPEKQIRELLAVLLREQTLVKVKEDLYYHAIPLAELQKKLIAFIGREGDIDAPRFKNLTGLSRKFTIPLLEYFDQIKVTIRVGDKRILRERPPSAA